MLLEFRKVNDAYIYEISRKKLLSRINLQIVYSERTISKEEIPARVQNMHWLLLHSRLRRLSANLGYRGLVYEAI